MINLYFNCKITDETLWAGKKNSIISKFEILKKTIKSFSVINFKNSIFNIEIDCEDSSKKNKELKSIIEKNIKSKKIILNYTRPSTIEQWQENIKIAENLIDKNEPVIVCMNHDHPYIDYSTSSFYRNIKSMFPKNANNFRKVFFYSHAPEAISSIFDNQKFQKKKPKIYKKKITKFVDSICIMSLETLSHIWKCKVFKGKYIGRFDWPDTGFTSSLNLTGYIYPREYFKHFDGYSHVTNLENISKFNLQSILPFHFPTRRNNKILVEFYYKIWENVFLLSIRDSLKKKIKNQKICTKIFLEEVKNSIILMDHGYFLNDFKDKLISKFEYKYIKNNIYNRVQNKSNYLINLLTKDIILTQKKIKLRHQITKIIFDYLPSWVMFEISNYKKKIFNFF